MFLISAFAAKPSDRHVQINYVTVTPHHPVKGDDVVINVSMTVGEYSFIVLVPYRGTYKMLHFQYNMFMNSSVLFLYLLLMLLLILDCKSSELFLTQPS